MTRHTIAALAALLPLAACTAAGPPGTGRAAPTEQASIPFVEFGNIFDWRDDGTRGVYIESDSMHWYYATFMYPCINLPFAETIGFKTTPPLPMDKFDGILVHHEYCPFATFSRVPGPPRHNAHSLP